MPQIRPRQLETVVGGTVAVATIVLLGALVPAGSTPRGVSALLLLLERSWPAGLWLLAAYGLGCLLSRACLPESGSRSMRLALGIAGLVTIDLVLGSLGLLGRGHEILAWAVILVLAPFALIATSRPRRSAIPDDAWRLGMPLGLPIGVLLLASTSAPGWLWGSEFGGYDALSYHLQLPREWWYAGGIVETPHNAYAHLPGGVSAAFLHLMTLVGDPGPAAITCQILVALTTIAAATATATLATAWATGPASEDAIVGTRSRLAALVLLSTPWVIVTGSLAYDEAFVILATVATLALLVQASDATAAGSHARRDDVRLGLALGLLLGMAILAKASSGVLVVAPAAIAAAILIPPRRWPAIVSGTLCAGVAVTLPWLIRNAGWTGNPVFPFATDLFGVGTWTDEQVERFRLAHGSPGIVDAVGGLFREYLAEDLLPTDPGGDPRRPQWWWLPACGLAAFPLLLLLQRRRTGPSPDQARARRRTIAMGVFVAAVLVAWMVFTHAKARFLLPTAPVLAAAIAVLGTGLATRYWGSRPIVVALAWLVPIAPAMMYATERDGSPSAAIGASDIFDGRRELEMITKAEGPTAEDLRSGASRAFVLRDLGSEARVLLVGVADPFHLAIEGPGGSASRFTYQTVWTRGPLERGFARIPDASPREAAAAVTAELRDAGYTHLLVAPTMLEVWAASGWLDPTLDPARIAALAGVEGVRTTHRFPDGGILIDLQGGVVE